MAKLHQRLQSAEEETADSGLDCLGLGFKPYAVSDNRIQGVRW